MKFLETNHRRKYEKEGAGSQHKEVRGEQDVVFRKAIKKGPISNLKKRIKKRKLETGKCFSLLEKIKRTTKERKRKTIKELKDR